MPGTDADGARLVAERARQAVADLGEPHAGADTGIVTISVGLTAAVPAAGQPDQLIKVADQALYEAKRDGRNRVVTG
jgi:diguanylate cyclase (GGDEF)-like protein